jgi:hypothetical protein
MTNDCCRVAARLLIATALPLGLMATGAMPACAGRVSVTLRKWLVALLVGSSIAGLCGAIQGRAQSLAQAALPSTPQQQKWQLQVLPNFGGLSNPFSINNRDWVAGAINPPSDRIGLPGL